MEKVDLTKEETYWLKTLDRSKVPGFMLGDILIKEDGTGLMLDTKEHVERAKILYAAGDFQGLYPSMSFERFAERSNRK